LESFGKLWKLKMPFSMTRKVLERSDFQNDYGKVLDFLFRKILTISQNGCSLVF